MPLSDDSTWHLDKKVPIVLIFAIFIQTVGVVWWASDVNGRVNRLEERTSVAEELNERVIRMEEQLKASNMLLYDIREELRKK